MDFGGAPSRSFLFLQGLASPFFEQLGRALIARGHQVHRINFNGGDCLFWRLGGALDFVGSPEEWELFLSRHLLKWRTTDIILFGDCRPLHVAAAKVAHRHYVQVHVVEEGYLRPNWVTFERDGVNGHSQLPREPQIYLSLAEATSAWTGGVEVKNIFLRRALQDIAYSLASALMYWRYRRHKNHRPWNPFVEYGGWAAKLAKLPSAERRTKLVIKDVMCSGNPYFVFPLQLDSDAQLRNHSNFGGIGPALRQVIGSFGSAAPKDAVLVVREHPLDNGLHNWRKETLSLARKAGLEQRVRYVETGDLVELLSDAKGLVTVNSTVGIIALSLGLPVMALGKAIYAMPRLTFQGDLDQFWAQANPPDAAVFDAFRRVVAARTQVNGGFFSTLGVKLAVQGALDRLFADTRQPDPGDFSEFLAPALLIGPAPLSEPTALLG